MPLPEPLAALLGGFEGLRLEYMVTGSVAAIIYGEPRLTQDVDIVARLERRDIPRFIQAYPSSRFYVPPAETIAAEASRPRHGHFNLIHLASMFRADVYPAGDDPLHQWALARRRREEAGGIGFSLAPPEYVILRKLDYYRQTPNAKHLRDIAVMLRVSEGLIDLGTIEAKAAELGVEPEWELARSRGGIE